jgi:hypothetical protein
MIRLFLTVALVCLVVGVVAGVYWGYALLARSGVRARLSALGAPANTGMKELPRLATRRSS